MTKWKPSINLSQLTLKRWWVDWFWTENFKVNEDTGCWEWTGNCDPRRGYGRLSINNRTYYAHRVAYFISYGEDPEQLLVRHKCNNPPCCNPEHLELGTHEDNSRDMILAGRSQKGDRHWMKRHPEKFEEWRLAAKGKLNLPKNGESHPCTVLTADLVKEIKIRAGKGEGNRELAKAYGVTHSNISAIVLGKSWKHVKVKMPPRVQDYFYARKLTEGEVKEIRRRKAKGESKASLARAFNVGQNAIFKIVNNITWKHVE